MYSDEEDAANAAEWVVKVTNECERPRGVGRYFATGELMVDGAVVSRFELTDERPITTWEQMDIRGAIAALTEIGRSEKPDVPIKVWHYRDYVKNSVTEWYPQWRDNGGLLLTKPHRPRNYDRVGELFALAETMDIRWFSLEASDHQRWAPLDDDLKDEM
jgi:ribonuclease HI